MDKDVERVQSKLPQLRIMNGLLTIIAACLIILVIKSFVDADEVNEVYVRGGYIDVDVVGGQLDSIESVRSVRSIDEPVAVENAYSADLGFRVIPLEVEVKESLYNRMRKAR